MSRIGTRAAGAATVTGLVVGSCVTVCAVVALLYLITGYVIPTVWWWIVSLPAWFWWAATAAALVWVAVTFVVGERRYKRGESR